MRSSFIDAKKAEFPISRMCKMLGVSPSGFHAWKDRPACYRQRQDMVLLAHVRPAFKLSNGTYGSPRMTRELQDDGHPVGRRRTAWLMRENGLVARQKRRFKRTTDSEHSWPVAPNLPSRPLPVTSTASTILRGDTPPSIIKARCSSKTELPNEKMPLH
jgi:putative transposase